MRKVAFGLGAVLAIVVVGVFIWRSQMQHRYENDRAKLEWQAAKLAQEVASHGAVPQDWDAGIFIGNQALAQVADQLKGLKLAVEDDDIVVEVQEVDLHGEATFLTLGMKLVAKSEKRNATLDLAAEAQLSYLGSVEAGDHREAHFRIVPITIDPTIGWYGFDIKGGKFASDLVVSGLLSMMLEAKPLAVPLQARLEKDIGLKEQEKLEGKDMPGAITIEYSVPHTVLSWKVVAVAPMILKDGLWLLARGSGSELSAPPVPAEMKRDDMAKETEAIRAVIGKITAPAHGAQLWVSSVPIFDLVRQFNELPADWRTVTVRTVAASGRLYSTDKDVPVLGKAEFYVELAKGNVAGGKAQVGKISSGWSPEKGLSIDLPVSAEAAANLHIHGDPSIGGGAGFPVRVEGGGSGAAAGSINFVHAVLDNSPVLAAVADYECRDITVEAKTDGKLKVDWGWASVPSVGARQKFLLDLKSLKPTVLLDGLPMPVAGRDKEGKPFVVDAGGRKVVVEPTWAALAVSVASGGAQATAKGWVIDADVAVAPMDPVTDEWLAAQAARRQQLADLALKQWPVRLCPKPDKLEIILGNIAIGPNNEIVKILVFLGKLPEAALKEAERIGKELTPAKVEEWVANPEKSFKKSGVGKANEDAKDFINDALGTKL